MTSTMLPTKNKLLVWFQRLVFATLPSNTKKNKNKLNDWPIKLSGSFKRKSNWLIRIEASHKQYSPPKYTSKNSVISDTTFVNNDWQNVRTKTFKRACDSVNQRARDSANSGNARTFTDNDFWNDMG